MVTFHDRQRLTILTFDLPRLRISSIHIRLTCAAKSNEYMLCFGVSILKKKKRKKRETRREKSFVVEIARYQKIKFYIHTNFFQTSALTWKEGSPLISFLQKVLCLAHENQGASPVADAAFFAMCLFDVAGYISLAMHWWWFQVGCLIQCSRFVRQHVVCVVHGFGCCSWPSLCKIQPPFLLHSNQAKLGFIITFFFFFLAKFFLFHFLLFEQTWTRINKRRPLWAIHQKSLM